MSGTTADITHSLRGMIIKPEVWFSSDSDNKTNQHVSAISLEADLGLRRHVITFNYLVEKTRSSVNILVAVTWQ